jgi:predicted TPR repeat methyltransferase
MDEVDLAALHDAYAPDYDAQVAAYDCNIADLLFGLCYDRISPGRRLLDAGIGTGLSSQLFARAGLAVSGMDFSQAMLDLCAARGSATDLKRHNLQTLPWPYERAAFDHVVCCGVLHFVPRLEGIFAEAARVLAPRGVFAFTTRAPDPDGIAGDDCERATVGAFDICSHAPAYVEAQLAAHGFTRRKLQRCFVGEDVFILWVATAAAR